MPQRDSDDELEESWRLVDDEDDEDSDGIHENVDALRGSLDFEADDERIPPTSRPPGRAKRSNSLRAKQSDTGNRLPPRRNRHLKESNEHISSTEQQFIMPTSSEQTIRPRKHNLRSSRAHLDQSPKQRSPTTPSMRPESPPSASRRNKSSENDSTALGQLFEAATDIITSSFTQVLQWSKPVISKLLALAFVAFVISMLLTSLNLKLRSYVAPVCSIPGASYLPFCKTAPLTGPVEFDQLMEVQSAFEDVLTSAAGGASLPLDMKRSEASIRDLKHVVRFSKLPSRNELVFEFNGFVETARQASSDLTRFNSRIGRAVDHILNTNRWTLQVIDGIAARDASRGAVSRYVFDPLYNTFGSRQPAQDALVNQYLLHANAVEERITELILEAQALLGILQNLDDRIDVIASIVTRDGVTVEGSREELLANLWTKLGGNRSSVNKLNEQLKLLKQVSVYQKTAWAHVSGTILKLQAIAAGLEDLRERVSAPEVVGVREDAPLQWHIENIQLGLERLEAQRTESRRVEGENYRSFLDGKDANPQRAVEGPPRVVEIRN